MFLVLLSLLGCSTNDIATLIKQQADSCNMNCVITIPKLTNYKWDKMYVFDNACSPEVIDSAIGMEYPYYKEFSKTMIFLNKGKIVHYENHEDKIETATNGSVIFDYPDSLHYQVYTPDKAKFRAKLVNFSKGTFYELSQQ